MGRLKLLKRSQFRQKIAKAGAPGTADAPVGGDFIMFDNEDSTFTVYGMTAAGNPVDISTVATLDPAPTSSDTSILTVDPPNGMSFAVHAVGPLGNAVVSVTATWNDGSLGPFLFDQPVTVQADPNAVTGIVVVPSDPVPRAA